MYLFIQTSIRQSQLPAPTQQGRVQVGPAGGIKSCRAPVSGALSQCSPGVGPGKYSRYPPRILQVELDSQIL